MKCRNCGYEIPSGELYCKRCGEEVRIVPDYNPLDDVLENQVKGGVTQALNTNVDIQMQRQNNGANRVNSQRQNTGRTAESRGRVRTNGNNNDYETRVRRRKQAERKRAIAKKKRQRLLIGSAVSIVAVLIMAVVIYQNSYAGQVKKGYNLIAEMQYDEAILRFEKALGKNDDKADAYQGLAAVYIAQGTWMEQKRYTLMRLQNIRTML